MRLVVLGRPGSGKGTQAALLARRYGLAHVSTGALLRDAVRRRSALGRRVAGSLHAGDLVADDLVIDLVVERLTNPDTRNGFVLDGVPRTLEQAVGLAARAVDVDVALNLAVRADVAARRLLLRRECTACGATVTTSTPAASARCPECRGPLRPRGDDTPSTIRRRLALSESTTAPVLAFYASQGRLVMIDGHGTVEEVAERIRHGLTAGSPPDRTVPTAC